MNNKKYGIAVFLSIVLGITIFLTDLIVIKQSFWNIPHSMKYLFLNSMAMLVISFVASIISTVTIFFMLTTKIGSNFYRVYRVLIEILSNVPYIITFVIVAIILGSGRRTVTIFITIYNVIFISSYMFKLKDDINRKALNTAASMAMSKWDIFLHIYLRENSDYIANVLKKCTKYDVEMLIISAIIGVNTLGTPIIYAFTELNLLLALVGMIPIVLVMLIIRVLSEE